MLFFFNGEIRKDCGHSSYLELYCHRHRLACGSVQSNLGLLSNTTIFEIHASQYIMSVPSEDSDQTALMAFNLTGL